jgi:hypothetical protein
MLCVITMALQSARPNVAMADQGSANAANPNQRKEQADKNKQAPAPVAPPAAKKTPPPPPKPPLNPPSYLAGICSIAPSIDGNEIEKFIGNPTPFTVKARDAQTLLIYSSNGKLTPADQTAVARICTTIKSLSLPPDATEELSVPSSRALGDIAARAKALNYPGITVQAAGDTSKLRISRAAWVSAEEYNDFKRDLLEMGLRLQTATPTSQLYYISAADAASALGADKSAKTDSSSKTKDNSAGPSTTVTVDTTSTQTVNNNPCLQPGKAAAPSDKNAAGGAPSTGDSSATANCVAPDSTAKTGDSGSSKKPSVSISSLNPDLLVFGVDDPAYESMIAEKKRILAALDFPRPEVIINTFSFQTSASQSKVLTDSDRCLQAEVGLYNDGIQMALNRTWLYLQCRANKQPNSKSCPDSYWPEGKEPSSFFDATFLKYLTMRFVADQPEPAVSQPSPESEKGPHVLKLKPETRDNLGLCPANEYCLGYTSLFKPLRMNLTDMLLAVIASNDPAGEIRAALDVMENSKRIKTIQSDKTVDDKLKQCKYDCAQHAEVLLANCDERDVYILRKAHLVNTAAVNSPQARKAESAADEIAKEAVDRSFMPLYCFDEEVQSAFPEGTGGDNAAKLLRSTLANFLFQYKMSQQYPHDFSPYLLNQSAQALNSQLNPLIVAFNRDLAAALRPLQDLADVRSCACHRCKSDKNGFWFWQGHDTRFVNNGIITIRTVSGKDTVVDTVTQNFFDATEPPSLTDLINSVGQAESNVPKVLKANLTANEAAVIIGALNSVKPATAQVGRQFKIEITPHSLSGASAAELDLQMVTGDQADPTRYSGGKSDPDNLSRIARQTTNTKVRLESIKLFDISSFSASLQRSRKNVPIIPPGFEIPYIGSVLSFPVAGGMQFHRSTAVMSAVVVPTAADLASGLEFVQDRLVVPSFASTSSLTCADGAENTRPCAVKKVYSADDLPPIWDYNRKKVQCFATGEQCGTLAFSNVLPQ